MRFSAPASSLALCLVLSACASSRGLQPSVQRLDPANLASARSLADVPLSSSAWPAQDWWLALGDRQLDQLIDEALQHNPDLAQAQARAKLAQASLESADAARQPSLALDASADGARLSSKDPIYPQDALGSFAWRKLVSLDFSWDLDLWGGHRAAWEAALGRTRAAQIDARAARIQLSVNVARAYVQLGYAFAQQDLAERELARAGKALGFTRALLDGGLGTAQQLHQADYQQASAQEQTTAAAQAIETARHALALLLGEGPDRGLRITRPALREPAATTLPEQLPVDLLGRRADLVAARWRVEAASKDIVAAKTQFLPDLSLGAMAGVIATGDRTDVFQLPARSYSVAPALSLPIFDGGHRRADLAAADAGYDAAVAHYNSVLLDALNQVAELVSALRSTRLQLTQEQRAQQDAQHGWDDAMRSYHGGVSGPLSALLSQQQLLAADQRLAALKTQQAALAIALVDALGGGYAALPATEAERPATESAAPKAN
jgi:NodT family efflux transporter outer membrane factor (OMF) lipoprotein